MKLPDHQDDAAFRAAVKRATLKIGNAAVDMLAAESMAFSPGDVYARERFICAVALEIARRWAMGVAMGGGGVVVEVVDE